MSIKEDDKAVNQDKMTSNTLLNTVNQFILIEIMQ